MPLALYKLMLESKLCPMLDGNPKFDLLLECRNDGTVARSSTEFLPTEGGTDQFQVKELTSVYHLGLSIFICT